MGCTAQLHSSSAIMDHLADVHVLGLSELGLTREEAKGVEIPGFTCIRNLARPHDPKHGGVAVYVKKDIAQYATVFAEHEELGILWVKLHFGQGTRALFVAMCYIPHGASGAHAALGAGRSVKEGIDLHFHVLNEDISRFAALGDVILMGDFNARVGTVSEVADMNGDELEGMDKHARAALAPTLLPYYSRIMHMPRNSGDKSPPNCLGNQVFDMCASHQLAILNGRLRGDEEGAITHFHRSGRGNSMIDLVIASPFMVWDNTGKARDGYELRVTPMELCPKRPDGGSFDHMPVRFSFPVYVCSPPQASESAQEKAAAFRWDESYRAAWVEVLTRHPDVLQHFHDMMAVAGEVSGGHAHHLFCQGLNAALAALNEVCEGRVCPARKGRARHQHARVHQPWFDDECRTLRKQVRQMERCHGAGSEEAILYRKAYMACVRSAKRRFDSHRLNELMQQFTADPRSFWQRFQQDGARVAGPDDMAKWTQYFRGLFEAVGKSEYVGGNVETHCRHFAELYGIPTQDALQAAQCLNAPFTKGEVAKVLASLANNKASGVDGVPAEFFKQASYHDDDGRVVNVLVPYLVCLFNAVLKGGYPREWAIAALVPVPKPKADHSTCDGFRGIAVGPALGKIYSMLLLQRMDAWAEKHRLRAAGQAGFRAGRSTIDNVFVLKHIINKYKAEKRPVYAVFIDFKKAYDSVDRELLWRCLENLGMHGDMLQSLRDMHADVQMKVRLNGGLGEGFTAGRGVRQGDPLSPLLFGLLIDRFEAFLTERHGDEGVQMGQQLLRLLLYADDLVLLANSRQQAQGMLNTLREFCVATCMTVNVAKSEVVVFNATGASMGALTYDGQDMPTKPFFVYLGVKLDATQVLGLVLSGRVAKAKATLHAMFRRCHELSIHNVEMQCRLFDTLVQPVLNYGCEVWGVEQLSSVKAVSGNGAAAEMLHYAFLRQSLGLRKSVARAVILRECNRHCMNVAWLKQALGFYNRVMKREATDVTRCAMMEDFTRDDKGSWAVHLKKCMRNIGCEEDACIMMTGGPVNIPKVVKALCDAQEKAAWETMPTTYQSVREVPDSVREGFKLWTYSNLFALEKGKVPGYIECLNDRESITALARYRMYSHSLGVETGRWGVNINGKRQTVARSQRLCTMCSLHDRDDELHILHCPAYAHFRLMYFGDVDCFQNITTDAEFKRLMNGDTAVCGGEKHFWMTMADYLKGVNLYRKEIFLDTT